MNIEQQYLNLLSEIVENGRPKQTRNGKVFSLFGKHLIHDFKDGFPLLTTKSMSLRNVFAELRWFLDGDTDIRWLWEQKCYIWDNDWYQWFCKNHGADYTIDELKIMANKMSAPAHFYDLGKIYGFQWRFWEGIDQIDNLIFTLRTNPDDRRMLVSAWNVDQLDSMALPPCHHSWQVWTAELTLEERFDLYNSLFIKEDEPKITKDDIPHYNWEMVLTNVPKRKISLLWNQRSVDVPLGLPYNIASYAMLLMMLANEVNMIPDELIANLGDCHVYENQLDGVKEQLQRTPFDLPTLKINAGINAQYEDLHLIDYDPHPKIYFPLS